MGIIIIIKCEVGHPSQPLNHNLSSFSFFGTVDSIMESVPLRDEEEDRYKHEAGLEGCIRSPAAIVI